MASAPPPPPPPQQAPPPGPPPGYVPPDQITPRPRAHCGHRAGHPGYTQKTQVKVTPQRKVTWQRKVSREKESSKISQSRPKSRKVTRAPYPQPESIKESTPTQSQPTPPIEMTSLSGSYTWQLLLTSYNNLTGKLRTNVTNILQT
ncbi:uncharacterized protein LOC142336790 [Convolutriloba macropyga]|uniref:uncharacterized protein LOC142336790 n=1 Tax=Convolutriloba macropyga TaxID=536237 RepID=UPI003F526EEE